jgi:folate-dependent phosphoribosylglycinamide formyltransferase PurN
VIPRALPGRVVSLPAQLVRSVVVVTGPTLYDQRTAYRLEQECGARLTAWLMLAQPQEPRSERAPAEGGRGRAGLGRHLRMGPRHLVRLTRSLPRRLRERRAWREYPRALAQAERRLLAQEIEAYRRRAAITPRQLGSPDGSALEQALRAANAGVVVAASPGLIPPELARTWGGPIVTVYPGWSPTLRSPAPVEGALFRRDLGQLGASVHLLADSGEPGPILRRSHPCLVPWDSPASCHYRVLALGSELLSEVVREILDRGEVVAYDAPAGGGGSPPPSLDGRVLAMLDTDHRRGWLGAALRDARRF